MIRSCELLLNSITRYWTVNANMLEREVGTWSHNWASIKNYIARLTMYSNKKQLTQCGLLNKSLFTQRREINIIPRNTHLLDLIF